MTRKKGLLNFVIYFISMYIVSYIILLIYSFAKSGSNNLKIDTSLTTDIYFFGIVNAIVLLILIAFNFQYFKEKLNYSFKKTNKTIIYAVNGFICIMLVLIIFSTILNVLKIDVSEAANQKSVETMLNNSNILVSILFIGIIIPILEEFLYRVSLLGILIKDQYSKNIIPYIAAAFIFALIHDSSFLINFNTDNLINFLNYFILSLVLTFTYQKTNHNFGTVCLIHIFNNMIPIIMMWLI